MPLETGYNNEAWITIWDSEFDYKLYRHKVEHGKEFIYCDCTWSTNLIETCIAFINKESEMETQICRICGNGPSNHEGKDHVLEAMDITAPSKNYAVTNEDYKNIYNEGIQNLLTLTPEQIVEHIAALERAIVTARIHTYVASMRLIDIEKDLSEEQKKLLREKSASYKVKEPIDDSPKKRAASKTQEDKALEGIMKAFSWTREQALEWVEKNKNKS